MAEDKRREEERQNEGYDEAARGGKGVRPSDVGIADNLKLLFVMVPQK